MSFNIYHNLVINTSPKEVFDAVTLPKHLDNWWTLKSSGKPELHAEYNLNFTDEYDWYCKVSQVKPNESFHLKMTKSDDDWNPTTFGFDLVDTKNGTLLKFSHVNWLKENNEFKNSSFCWAMLLNDLKNYLEEGKIVPFDERN
ncbi:SRPBCC domain-containing protein [Flavobacteriaceae bacterium S0825]|uniref:SRPBCC family protein n=1 Tax=Gaetbulibacter sp. S0825 TaxID=2720084 RepID=UPI00143132AD|nr:SRPBCC domain-containing protein [Gaetbulibacter sp. S0825]MCK0110155.1 SRPBCC domain-containing protein [Flavobacteriaceae bacterium S0825]NIX65784.1 SRPBCC domain-containing protein [Gaetbulibacter sp. S0825]